MLSHERRVPSKGLPSYFSRLAEERGITYIDVATAYRYFHGLTDGFYNCIDNFNPTAFYKAVTL